MKKKIENWNGPVNGLLTYVTEHFDTSYGKVTVTKLPDLSTKVEFVTGGWYENERVLDILSQTMFHFLCWQESRRGGYTQYIIQPNYISFKDMFWGNPKRLKAGPEL